ncbi:hypothetical protein OIV83_003184 [Microbotryomycetes sp. JL201]|nr:hypothetical protein OIV83_003184 [Microbotryomycetes sp. JL201]
MSRLSKSQVQEQHATLFIRPLAPPQRPWRNGFVKELLDMFISPQPVGLDTASHCVNVLRHKLWERCATFLKRSVERGTPAHKVVLANFRGFGDWRVYNLIVFALLAAGWAGLKNSASWLEQQREDASFSLVPAANDKLADAINGTSTSCAAELTRRQSERYGITTRQLNGKWARMV